MLVAGLAAEGADPVEWVGRWWRQDDHYDWLMAYLKTRNLVGPVRALTATATLSGSVIPLALTTIPEGPRGDLPRAVACTVTIGLLLLGLMWAATLPSRHQSAGFTVGVSGCIGVAALTCHDPTVAILICTTFAIVAGYVAFVHTAIYAVYTFTVSTGVAATEAVRLAAAGKWLLGACGFWLILALTVSVPAGIQIIVHSLGIDLLHADSDPLTLALNRRAFLIKTQELIHRRRDTDRFLVLMVIDLDGFKTINDAMGHVAGDHALATVAEVLRRTSRDTAVIGRSGGDEFLIADTTRAADHQAAADRLRQAIADIPYPITASIGTVTATMAHLSDSISETLVNNLMAAADHQMYRAKRRGGNQTSHAVGQE
nr:MULTISPECIES: GGDEF domain-containing protein [unclassified Mycolicibacterium]